jgi:hypothetical protein
LLDVTTLHISDRDSVRGTTEALSGRGKPKRVDWLCEALCSRRCNPITQQTHCRWGKRYVHFHSVRETPEISEPEINAVQTRRVVQEKISPSRQNRALSALVFVFYCVLESEAGHLADVVFVCIARPPPAAWRA